jgi:hypothetical protein
LEGVGPTMFARLGIMRALNRGYTYKTITPSDRYVCDVNTWALNKLASWLLPDGLIVGVVGIARPTISFRHANNEAWIIGSGRTALL